MEENIEQSNIEAEELKRRVETIEQSINELKEINERKKPEMERINTQLIERDKIEEAYVLGKKITGTTHATPGTETTHLHYLGRTPSFIFITSTSNGLVYKSKAADKTSFYVKGSAANLTFDAYILI
ncbi:MAG: hypothetical protein ACTSQA_01670 [Candidatus Heimdallarchaeaceae archaeon]